MYFIKAKPDFVWCVYVLSQVVYLSPKTFKLLSIQSFVHDDT